MRFALAALALLPTALGAINIVGPSPSSYWVQNTSNVITWTYTQGDPSPVDILVVNPDNTTLNGDFSIARFVDTSIMSFTVTNVTLRTGSGFQVQFVNSTNATQVYATSQSFDVRPSGTAPAPTATGSNGTASSTGSGSGSPSNTASGTNTAASPSLTAAENAAPQTKAGVLGIVAACGLASLAALL